MSIKKAELHVHLEGTISPQMVLTLAQRNKIPFNKQLITQSGEGYLSNNFLDFLHKFDLVANVIKKPLDYYDLTLDYLKSCAKDEVIYVEMMYSPDHAQHSSGIPSSEHLKALQQAIDDAEHQFGIIGRILLTGVRHFGKEAVEAVAKEAHKFCPPCVVGFGLGGDEIKYPPHLFAKAYEIAKDAGLSCTVHAGEFSGAEGIVEALNILPVTRIGHGVNAIFSKETMALIKERDIALELCPTSNVFLGLFKDLASHPFPKFYEYGIKVSLNSDDPPFMGTTVGKEYQKVQKAYGYSDDIMKNITKMAINSAFVDSTTKEKLIKMAS